MGATMEWGVTPEGTLTHIKRAENGRKCGLICVGCEQPLIAKQGPIRQWHFSHDVPDAVGDGACEGYLHMLVKVGLTACINSCLHEGQPGFPVHYICAHCSGTHVWRVAQTRSSDWENDGEWSVDGAVSGQLPAWFEDEDEWRQWEEQRQRKRQATIPVRAEAERGTTVNRPDISLFNDNGEVLSTIEVVVGNLSDKAGLLGKPTLVIRPAELEALPERTRDWPSQLKLRWLVEGAILHGASERGHSALNIGCPVCAVCNKDTSRGLIVGSHYHCPICAAHCNPSDDSHQCPPRYLSNRCGICKTQTRGTLGLSAHMAFAHGLTADFTYNGVNPSYVWRKIGEGDKSTARTQWGQAIPVRPTPDEWGDWDSRRSNQPQDSK